MKSDFLAIVHLFGSCEQGSFKEDFIRLECSCTFKLTRMPTMDELLSTLPKISDSDSWRLQLLSENGDDLFDLRPDGVHGDEFSEDSLRPYLDTNIQLIYIVDKNKLNSILNVYEFSLLIDYLQNLSVTQFISVLEGSIESRLVLLIWDGASERFYTNSIAVLERGEHIPELPGTVHLQKRTAECGKYCQWTSKIARLLPDDLHIVKKEKDGTLSVLFDQMCLLLSSFFVADCSGLEKDLLKIRISGFKTLFSESEKVRVNDLSFDLKSAEQWFNIYDWCYTGGYISDRLIIARNIISLNCRNFDALQLNPSTLDAIKSNFRIFEQDNVRQYIKVRNDVSEVLLDLQDKINSIVEGFAEDYKKNVIGLGTFFLTLVVVRTVADRQWSGAFSSQIVVLSFLFILISAVLLVYSRQTLEKKEKLYTKHYKQLRERYEPLLSKEEADKIFEDADPNKSDTHLNYIQWQKNKYTKIWIYTLVFFSLFLVVAWCHNLFETTNVYKYLKALVSCCTKNI